MKEEARQLSQEPVEVAASSLPPPLLSYVGGDNWRLEADYTYQDGDRTITVPAGFMFDLSSVPRALWWLIAPFELSIVAPLLHDYLYEHGGDLPAGSVHAAARLHPEGSRRPISPDHGARGRTGLAPGSRLLPR